MSSLEHLAVGRDECGREPWGERDDVSAKPEQGRATAGQEEAEREREREEEKRQLF